MPLLTSVARAAAAVIVIAVASCANSEDRPIVPRPMNEEKQVGDLSFRFRRIPAGEVITGGGPRTLNPVRRFTVHEFWLATTPVTNLDYEKFDPSRKKQRPPFSALDTSPVTGITWHEALGYCQWLSSRLGVDVRLPTSIEWEHACLGGNAGPYPFGKTGAIWDNSARRHANFLNRNAVAVARYAANGYGLYDLVGNVAEMCADAYVFDEEDVRHFPGDPRYADLAVLPKSRLKAVKNCPADVPTLYGCECGSLAVTDPDLRDPTLSFRVAVSSFASR